jgi:hypothetical protein
MSPLVLCVAWFVTVLLGVAGLAAAGLELAELVGVNNVMPQGLRTRYFLEARGYGVKDSVIHQDNKSSILLEKHGRASSSKGTRHTG